MQADQPPFPNTNQQVVVFDPETADLRSVPFSRIDCKLINQIWAN